MNERSVGFLKNLNEVEGSKGILGWQVWSLEVNLCQLETQMNEWMNERMNEGTLYLTRNNL